MSPEERSQKAFANWIDNRADVWVSLSGWEWDQMMRHFSEAIRAAVAEEREACAKIAEQPYSDAVGALGHHQPFTVGSKIASAIRDRAA